MQRVILGVKSITLTEATDTFMSLQENVNRNHALRYYTSAKWVVKDLLKDTIWAVRRQVLNVSKKGTVQLPCDVERLLGLSVVDSCGNLQSLFYNEDVNTLALQTHKITYSCPSCGGDDVSLCCVFDNITYTDEAKEMTIADVNGGAPALYRIRTYIIKDEFGHVSKEIEIYGPLSLAPDPDPAPLVKKYTERVCDLEVTECGCIAPTEENIEKVEAHLCCHMPLRCEKPSPSNKFGYFKEDATDSSVLHVYRDITQVIATYQSSWESADGGEIMIPEYVFDAFAYGMDFKANAFVNSLSPSTKREQRRLYFLEKKKLWIYLNPISKEQFEAMAGVFRKWG